MLRIEQDPRFTRGVVELGLIETPVVLLDVGARGGVAQHWSVFGDSLRLLAVDPDDAEPGESRVVADGVGTRNFYTRSVAATNGLYATEELFSDVERSFEVVSVDSVETADLVSLFGEDELAKVDVVKADVELAELDVLRGAGPVLEHSLALELEVHFPKRPADAGCFAEVDEHLRRNGFELYDLDVYRYARAGTGVPVIYDFRDERGEPTSGPTSEGQVLTGDALYVRADWPVDTDRVLKLACIFELHRLRDCAVSLLERHDIPVPGELAAWLRRPYDSLVSREGRPYGPNYHVFEDLWRRRSSHAASLAREGRRSLVPRRRRRR